LIQGVALLACMPFVVRVREPSFDGDLQEAPLRTLWRETSVKCGLAIGAGLYLAVGAFDAIWAKFLSDAGASSLMIAVSVTLFTAPLVVLTPLGGRIADSCGPARVGVVGMALLPPVLAAFALNTSYWPIIAISLGEAVLISMCWPAGLATIARGSRDDLVAAGQGLSGAVSAAAAAIASVLSGILYVSIGKAGTWLVLAGCSGIFAVLAFHWKPTYRSTRGRLGETDTTVQHEC
jgi:MFS family permease